MQHALTLANPALPGNPEPAELAVKSLDSLRRSNQKSEVARYAVAHANQSLPAAWPVGLRQCDLAIFRRWPHKPAFLQTLGEQAGSLPIPPDHFDKIAAPSPEDKHVAGERILVQGRLGLCRQSGKATPHVGHPGCQPDLRIRRNWDHTDRPRIRRARASGS